jgi:hypothetical protein
VCHPVHGFRTQRPADRIGERRQQGGLRESHPARSFPGQREGEQLMSGSRWRAFKGVGIAHEDGRERPYVLKVVQEARLQAHYATQWLARAARAYAVPRPDDHHTNLGWDDSISGLTTHALAQDLVLGLGLRALRLVIWEGPGRAAGPAIDLQGLRDADIRQWLGGQLSAKGLDAAALDAPSPYEMPAHPIGGGAPYGGARAPGLGAALAELAAWLGNANLALGETRQHIVARGIAAPPVRLWPHHFDLDSLVSRGSGVGAYTVGLGFSAGDAYYEQPYFYLSRYPPPDVAALPALPPVGHWHTHHFTAAVAVADRILAASDPQAATEGFLRAATEILVV